MIDTIAWTAKVAPEQSRLIKTKSSEYSQYDHEAKAFGFKVYKNNLHLGSFDTNISLFLKDDEVRFEFSLPKQIFGSNVELIYPCQVKPALTRIYDRLVSHFGDFPVMDDWIIQRLDLCYAWRFKDLEQCLSALEYLKSCEYPRKSKFLYPESVMWRGRTFSVKFYLKHEEFETHDYKTLIKIKQDYLAEQLWIISKNVLRFEISIRKQALLEWFDGVDTIEILLDEVKLEEILNKQLSTIVGNLDKKVTEDIEILELLDKKYDKEKANRLFSFYQLYNSPKPHQRKLLKDRYSPATIWRNKKELAEAGIGLPFRKGSKKFSLEIPSEIVVNKSPLAPRDSGEA